MSILLVLPVTVMILTFAYTKWRGDKLSDTIGLTCIFGFFSFVACGVVLLIGGVDEGRIKNGDVSGCTKTVYSEDIASVSVGESLSGSFFLGSGSIGNARHYYAYVQHDKGLLLTSYRASNVYIVEGDGPPRYTHDNFVCPKPFTSFMVGGERFRINRGWNKTLHVPKNTVIREFKL